MSYRESGADRRARREAKLGTASKVKYDNELAKEIKDDVFRWYADIEVDLKALLAEEVAAAGARTMQLGELASAEAAETSSAAAKRAVTGSKAVRRANASDVLREAEAAAQSSDKVQRADAIVAGTLFSETTRRSETRATSTRARRR